MPCHLPMPRPLSLDLRQRIVRAYLDGEGTQAQLARRFAVSEMTVRRLLQRQQASGHVAPTPQRHGPTPRIDETHRPLFEAWLAEDPSLSQTELAERFAEETGRHVSQQTISRSFSLLRITHKKRR